MNTNLKIKSLWEYLNIQDDGTLIVRNYNREKGSDEYIVAKKKGDELETSVAFTLNDCPLHQSFTLIEQRGDDGKHQIPSVEQMERDRLMDY